MSGWLRAVALMVLSSSLFAQGEEIVPSDSLWRIHKSISEASTPDPTAWRGIAFDDSTWPSSPAPFYYENSPGTPTSYTGNTDLTDMFGQCTCLYLRRAFVISNPQALSSLELTAASDDGFIAWINGVQVARFNMPDGDIPFNGTSSPALPEPVPWQTNTIQNLGAILVPGTNVLAVQAFNSSLANSSDFLIWVQLTSAVDQTPPVVAGLLPNAGATVPVLTQIEVDFSEGVTGVEADALLINGLPAAKVTPVTDSAYIFEFAQPATGLVQVAWAPNQHITDFAPIPNAFAGGAWTYRLDPKAIPPGVIISEFMADNHKTLRDEDGDSSDWIELFNSGNQVANLAGWYLTDTPTNLIRWRFPSVSMPTNSYLVVFASGKNRANPAAPLHTNFRLNRSGGYLALVDPATNIVSEFAPYPAQYADVSYGRDRSDPALLAYFPSPTPGARNSLGGPGFAPEVIFSRQGGTFVSPFPLSLSAGATNAEIHYTVDNSLPTTNSPIYTNAITINKTTQVRALALQRGLLPGPPHSESYLVLGTSVLSFTSDLPLVVIHNFGGGTVPAGTRQFAFISVYEPGLGRSSLTNRPTLTTRAGINIRGSSTLGQPKHNFRLEFWDDLNDPHNAPFLGLPSDNDWILYAPDNFEPVLIHNPFIHELSRRIGRYSSRTRFCEVYVNTSGGAITSANYNGVYVLEEKIKVAKERVDIDQLQPENNTPPSVTGGYLMSIDRPVPGEGQIYAANQGINALDPKWTDLLLPQRAGQWRYLNDYLTQFGNALYGSSYLDPLKGYRPYVDTDAWIDHHILNILAFNVDALRLSAFFYKPRLGKLTFGPLWDFDRSLDSTDGRDANPRVWRSQSGDLGTDMFHYPWWDRMFTDPDFWQRWIDRWQELRRDQFALTNLWGLVDSMANEVREAERREAARWPGFTTPRGGTYQAEVNLLKNWLSNRVAFIDTNFQAAPKPSLPGGSVAVGTTITLAAPAGASIYYTLDGSDPRASGGGIALGARLYTNAITVAANVRLVTRARDLNHHNLTGTSANPPISSPWSGPVAATYVTATPTLAITEIMYNPPAPPASSTNVPGDFEYLELQNVGTTPLSLVGFQFTTGIQYTFTTNSAVTALAPGACVVLVKNLAAFMSRYPGVTNIAGEYTGSLDNAGERLALEGPYQEPVLDFSYDPRWYPTTDGHGFSLVRRDPAGAQDNLSTRAGWRASSTLNGSPGQVDAPPPALVEVWVNEVLAYPVAPMRDTVELFNPSATPVNIAGWFLSDAFSQPFKYRFPDPTLVPANGFRLVEAKEFDSGAVNSFGLSSLGDGVHLFSGDGTNLTGYYDGFTFGASPEGMTFGRYQSSDGQAHLVLQTNPSLGGTNSGPLLGPVVINEVMYLAGPVVTNSAAQYVELYNRTSQGIPLYDPAVPTNTWRLQGGLDFSFPTNVVLPPHGFLLLVTFDPRLDPWTLAGFLALYPSATNALVLGPIQGTADPAGNHLALVRPGPPRTATQSHPGEVPLILVDEVRYSSQAPWPADAAGTGKSLQRLAANSYGDDPINWWAAPPSPGALNATGNPKDTDGDGLPDQWELTYGLSPTDPTGDNGPNGDPDGDGLTNYQEFLAGTDPHDATSALRLEGVQVSSDAVSLQFLAMAGHSYTIQARDTASSGAWRKVQDVTAPATTQVVRILDPATPRGATRFYRLVTPSQP